MPAKKPSEGDTAFDAIATLQNAGFGNMMAMNAAWMEAVSDIGAEVVGFVADRIQEDIKTQQKILQCKDMAELQGIQAEFFQKAIDQYQAETGKLVELGKAAMTQGTADQKS